MAVDYNFRNYCIKVFNNYLAFVDLYFDANGYLRELGTLEVLSYKSKPFVIPTKLSNYYLLRDDPKLTMFDITMNEEHTIAFISKICDNLAYNRFCDDEQIDDPMFTEQQRIVTLHEMEFDKNTKNFTFQVQAHKFNKLTPTLILGIGISPYRTHAMLLAALSALGKYSKKVPKGYDLVAISNKLKRFDSKRIKDIDMIKAQNKINTKNVELEDSSLENTEFVLDGVVEEKDVSVAENVLNTTNSSGDDDPWDGLDLSF